MNDTFNLQRFLDAQHPVFERVLQELHAGHKTSHWMWFIFPQLDGLGHSEMARRYAISGKAEAEAYLAHPILGPRLMECVSALLAHDHKSALQILGHPDDLKLHSCLTLFAEIAADRSLFQDALDRFFHGQDDMHTARYLSAPAPGHADTRPASPR